MATARSETAGPEEAPRARLRVAFALGIFPLVSETFVIDQIAQLSDRGVEVDVFSLTRGDETHVSQTYFDYDMGSKVEYLDYPLRWLPRFRGAWPKALSLAGRHPRILLRTLNVLRYRRWTLSLKLLYWVEPLAGREYDVVHCHFGTVARDFVKVRDAAMLNAPLVTSFYGVDVSRVFRDEPPSYYDDLKKACSLYFVMSADMKRRVVEHGFPADQVRVHPVSIAVEDYPFGIRTLSDAEELRLMAVGRFVEKKGFDDLLRALAIVKERSNRPVSCVVVGGGPLEPELRRLSESLGLQDVVCFPGLMAVEEVIERFSDTHLLVQPSKTAADGDME
jgi:colanic acid/amylovoran biosynthesis glycosyltransferase